MGLKFSGIVGSFCLSGSAIGSPSPFRSKGFG
jgi:hypothetical protein